MKSIKIKFQLFTFLSLLIAGVSFNPTLGMAATSESLSFCKPDGGTLVMHDTVLRVATDGPQETISKVELIDVSGAGRTPIVREVKNKRVYVMNLRQLPAGQYNVVITTSEGPFTESVVR